MQTFTLKKIAVISALMIILLIALEMVSGVVSERTHFRNSARQSISKSWTGAQKLIGPILVIPYTETVSTSSWDSETKKEVVYSKQILKKFYLMPEKLAINADVKTEQRYRGMYAVPVYASEIVFKGHYDSQQLMDKITANDAISSLGQPYLSLIINDIRGIPERPEILWQGQVTRFDSGSSITSSNNGMHVLLPEISIKEKMELDFYFALTLRGMESLSFAPTGINTTVKVISDWPHPGFIGRYLPEQRQINEEGFVADWRVSSFSSGIKQQLEQCNKSKCQPLLSNTFGVSLTQPVDIYQQSERSIKYGILFITLTFTSIIIFELIKQLQIHPVQYLLVGLALVIFYLLLVSLSEHIAFHWAYLAAASACSGLLGFYLCGVFGSFKQGLFFASLIVLLYGILFIIIRAEDFALLMGCLLLFLALSLLMLLTRKIDWYALGNLEAS